MRTNLAILILAASLIGLHAARAEDAGPPTEPMARGDAYPPGDYVSHGQYGPPLVTYTTQTTRVRSAQATQGEKPQASGESMVLSR